MVNNMKNRKNIIAVIIFITILIVCIGGYLVYGYINIRNRDSILLNNKISNYHKLEKMDYSKEAIKKIDKYGIFDIIIKNKYSKTLDVSLQKDEFDKNNLDLYLNIKYIDKDDFIEKINKLSNLGYGVDEIKYIFNNMNYDDIKYITDFNYINNLKDYLKYKNFDIKKLNRYINYRDNNSTLDLNDIIMNVNMDLDKKEYVDYKIIENTDSELILVNKYNRLPDNYNPTDLKIININCSVKTLYMRNNAKEAFDALCSDARSLGLSIKAISSYRTNNYQEGLYNDYSNRNGTDKADTYSARARFSEHETGLCVDVMGSNKNYTKFSETNEYKWMIENAHNYGFILRYPKGKENITKYMFESWHFRYVGHDAAKYIYDNNITLEEYIALYNN